MGRTANATLGRSNGTTTGHQVHAGKRSTPGGAKSSTPLRAGANSSGRLVLIIITRVVSHMARVPLGPQ